MVERFENILKIRYILVFTDLRTFFTKRKPFPDKKRLLALENLKYYNKGFMTMTNQARLKLKQFENSADSADATEEVKPKSKSKTVRGCIFEVCVDLEYFDTVPDFSKCAESTGADKYMWKIHDCDVYGKDDQKALREKGLDISKYPLGAPKNDHVHIFMRFKSPTTLPKIAKAFGVPAQNVQRWSGAGAWGNAVSYLTHRTSGAENKYQYDPSDVHANFDYVQKLAEVTEQVAGASARRLSKTAAEAEFESLKELYSTGQISFTELNRRLVADPRVLDLAAKYKRRLDAMRQMVDQNEVDKFFATFKQPLRVIWLYGEAGCGKSLAATTMAERFAKKRFPDEPALDNSYQILGSSRGPFEQYLGSVHCVVLDDFRESKAFTLADLFRNLDPNHKGGTTLPGRFHDRKLAAGIVIITTPYDPAEFSYRFQGVWTAIQRDLDTQLSAGVPLDAPAKKIAPKLDAIKMAQLGPGYNNSPEKVWTADQIKSVCAGYAWNLVDKPDQIMRRVTVYNVSRSTDDAVLFQRMRPVKHDNGYYDYEKAQDDSRLSLEEVWEGKSLDFNPGNTSPYNYYNRNFTLDYQDQTLSKEADFMMRFRKTYLYIHGGEKSRYLDDYNRPEIEVKEVYDSQAFEAVMKKIKEDDNHDFDEILKKLDKKLDAM